MVFLFIDAMKNVAFSFIVPTAFLTSWTVLTILNGWVHDYSLDILSLKLLLLLLKSLYFSHMWEFQHNFLDLNHACLFNISKTTLPIFCNVTTVFLRCCLFTTFCRFCYFFCNINELNKIFSYQNHANITHSEIIETVELYQLFNQIWCCVHHLL